MQNETELFDVVAVNMDASTIRFLARGKTEGNAEAVVNMAVMRRGVDEEFYAAVPAGMYAQDGETWRGHGDGAQEVSRG
jgi:hypothetical protein